MVENNYAANKNFSNWFHNVFFVYKIYLLKEKISLTLFMNLYKRNISLRPVLKHGPRSLSCMQVL